MNHSDEENNNNDDDLGFLEDDIDEEGNDKNGVKYWIVSFLFLSGILVIIAPDAVVPLLEEVLMACAAPAIVILMLLMLSRVVPMGNDDDYDDEGLELLPRRTTEEIKDQLRTRHVPENMIGESCDICQEEYVVDDDIALSSNTDCTHRFHPQCITEWLTQSIECPICRRDYLRTISADPSADDEEKNHVIDSEETVLVISRSVEEEETRRRRR